MIDTDIFDSSSQNSSIPWHVRLWAAVLRRAAVDYALYKEHSGIKLKKTGTDAHRWLFSDEDHGEVGSFEIVCSMLGLPMDLVRDRVERLTEDEARRLRGMEFGDVSF